MKIKIRRYQNGDAEFLDEIYYNTIHTINAQDYTKEQLDAWAPKFSESSLHDFKEWQKKLEKIKPFVALIDNVIVGFVEFEPTGHIECFYVHHEYQGCGVGSALMSCVDKEAQKKLLVKVDAEVSITAKSFFDAHGFKVVKKQIETCDGVELTHYVMEKKYFYF